MGKPSKEQERILGDESRVRVVRAAPGSGKTWLIAEMLRQELGTWTSLSSGVAVLSFTNVASSEVRSQLGFIPAHPHFVGTFDSFLFRFLVRPFARVLCSELAPPILIDAARADTLADKQSWSRKGLSVQLGTTKERAHLFRIHFREMNDGQPTFSTRVGPRKEARWLTGQPADEVFESKKRSWRESRLVTHSDVAFLAAAILRDQRVAPRIQRILSQRFPVLIVDELQDTGHFHSEALLELAGQQTRRVVAVGDPDQAIYGFTGATRGIFERLETLDGATTLELRQSRRCPEVVCKIAEQLSDSQSAIESLSGRRGSATIVRCDSLEQARDFASSRNDVTVLARTNTLVEAFNGSKQRSLPRRTPQVLRQLHQSVVQFEQGNLRLAFDRAEGAFGRLVFDTESVQRTILEQHGIAAESWRAEIATTVCEAVRLARSCKTLFDWCAELSERLKARLGALGWPAENLGRKLSKAPDAATKRPTIYGSGQAVATEARTIHSAKGQTLDNVILLVNPKQKEPGCPSEEWWSDSQRLREERRVTFVAVTRARESFCVLVPTGVYERLEKLRPDFIALLDSVDEDE